MPHETVGADRGVKRPRPVQRAQSPPSGLPVLDLARRAAPDVVPVELLFVLDVVLVVLLGIVAGDDDALAIELAVLLRLLGGIELARLGLEADREAHAAL